jgi:hypothetical protein
MTDVERAQEFATVLARLVLGEVLARRYLAIADRRRLWAEAYRVAKRCATAGAAIGQTSPEPLWKFHAAELGRVWLGCAQTLVAAQELEPGAAATWWEQAKRGVN